MREEINLYGLIKKKTKPKIESDKPKRINVLFSSKCYQNQFISTMLLSIYSYASNKLETYIFGLLQ